MFNIMYIVYIAAAILVAVGAENVVVVNVGPYSADKVQHYKSTSKYTMEELDDMFTTFHSVQSIMRVFNKTEYRELVEIHELLAVYEQKKAELLKMVAETENVTHSYPFIMIDGFQNSGKLAVAKRLVDTIGCDFVVNPPYYLLRLRVGFDSLNFELRSAFYALANYLTAYHVMCRRKNRPVIVNRYWPSLMSYALASNRLHYGVYPNARSIIFSWPSDLLKPDAVYIIDRSFCNKYLSTEMCNKMVDVYKTMQDPKVFLIPYHFQKKCKKFEDIYLTIQIDIQRRFNLTI